MATLGADLEVSIAALRRWMEWHTKDERLIGEHVSAVLRSLESMMTERRESAEGETRVMRVLARAVDELVTERNSLQAKLDALSQVAQ